MIFAGLLAVVMLAVVLLAIVLLAVVLLAVLVSVVAASEAIVDSFGISLAPLVFVHWAILALVLALGESPAFLHGLILEVLLVTLVGAHLVLHAVLHVVLLGHAAVVHDAVWAFGAHVSLAFITVVDALAVRRAIPVVVLVVAHRLAR